MKRIKIVTVVGTRPEIIRLSAVINRLNNSNFIDHKLIHTGQNYDKNLNEIFFQDLEINKPDFYLDAAKGSANLTIGEILLKIDPILDKINPDAMLILGDTNSCLSSIAARKKKIPIFHFEAGNRCFDFRVPEETNRRLVDHISDINLTYSSNASQNLLNEGIPADRIIKVGSPMYEIIQKNLKKIQNSKILSALKLSREKYFLISCHREENINSTLNFNKLIKTLNTISEVYEMPVIFPVHPRTKKIITDKAPKLNKNIRLIDPIGFIDYNQLQINSFLVLSDSGTISEESSILNFRALNIRETHERHEAMEEASVIMTGLEYNRVLQGIESVKDQKTGDARNILEVTDYKISNVSLKIERIILSYINYVNRVVWQKES
ncbi:MAG: UDP-N-acetylglucosamine 2-epimerase (non-hydrolyzing) [Pelagibacterales bacterium]|nr:UDP-N-acetylglucosamine 2-epimerase (non-hydrolyzing) [Pelagibacterales bacterium]|tara:strand:- start:627 stop:1766 length:1140 start_codon:yes stop_codon:yes gene_type:complete